MKKLSFWALAAVGLLFGACASNDAVDEKGGQDPFKGRDGGFIKVGISLPTQPYVSTRAWEEGATGTLADGLDTEYKVQDCILLLFEGTTEAGATLKQVESITEAFNSFTDNPNQVTTNATKTIQLSSAPSANLYAMAVINGAVNKIIEMKSTTEISILEGADVSGITLGDLQAATADIATNKFITKVGTDNFFFMVNAVLSQSQGGTVDPGATPTLHTLAPVDASRIYETEAEANATDVPSCDIYVERAVAKVTIDGTATDYLSVASLKNDDGSTVSAATLTGWALDQKNAFSYVVRNATPFSTWNLNSFSAAAAKDKYRFVGFNPVDGGYTTKVANTGYRTYWAIDPNYNKAWDATQFVQAVAADYSAGIGDENPQYCFENTFDVEHMTHNQTTRVVLNVKLNGGADFYTVGVDKKTLYKLDDVKKKFAAALMGNATFLSWWNNADPAKGGSGTLTYDKITMAFDKSTAGVLKVTSITIDNSVLKATTDITFNNSSSDIEGSNLSGVINTINAVVGKVTFYDDGATYYSARIKHFGDDLTPWNNGEYLTAPKEAGIDDIYPNDARRDANYLGRYGMVRNNWYVLQVGSIAKIGSATVPDVDRLTPGTPDPDDPEPDPEHPDDELEDAFIKARINILSWAKRPQAWNLKK